MCLRFKGIFSQETRFAFRVLPGCCRMLDFVAHTDSFLARLIYLFLFDQKIEYVICRHAAAVVATLRRHGNDNVVRRDVIVTMATTHASGPTHCAVSR